VHLNVTQQKMVRKHALEECVATVMAANLQQKKFVIKLKRIFAQKHGLEVELVFPNFVVE